MKKKLMALLATCTGFLFLLAGCQAALVESSVDVKQDGSGIKIITVVIYGDDSLLAGKTSSEEEGSTVGNNSKYLLVYGTELENKVKSYSALSDINVSATEQNGDTVLTISYSFIDTADYTAKTKTLAKDNADKIEAPVFTANEDGSYTYKENCDNTYYSVDNLFASLWNDETAFDKTGMGDCDLEQWGYNYTCIYTIMSVSATVGDKTVKVEIAQYNSENTVVELDYPDFIEVTGTYPAVTEPPISPINPDNEKDGSYVGLIVGITVAAVVVVGAVIAIVIVTKKKSKKY